MRIPILTLFGALNALLVGCHADDDDGDGQKECDGDDDSLEADEDGDGYYNFERDYDDGDEDANLDDMDGDGFGTCERTAPRPRGTRTVTTSMQPHSLEQTRHAMASTTTTTAFCRWLPRTASIR